MASTSESYKEKKARLLAELSEEVRAYVELTRKRIASISDPEKRKRLFKILSEP